MLPGIVLIAKQSRVANVEANKHNQFFSRAFAIILVTAITSLGSALTTFVAGASTPQSHQVTGAHVASEPVSGHDLLLIGRAIQGITKTCMKGKGFTYKVQPSGAASLSAPLPYTIPTLSSARRNGFGQEDSIVSEETYLSKLSWMVQQRYLVALIGAPPPTKQVFAVVPQGGRVGHSAGGCQAAAERALYTNFRKWFQVSTIVGSYQSIAQSEVNTSARFRILLSSWRQCTEARGFNWPTPIVAISSYSHPPNEPSKSEISAAVTAASCAARIGMMRVASQLFAKDVARLPNDYRKEVRAFWEMQTVAVSTATAYKH